jgi:LysM repeat protein
MSRRDTIIIALLINVGLLAVLFMLAVNVDDDIASPEPKSSQMALDRPRDSVVEFVSSGPGTEIVVKDEVDTFLKELKTGDSNKNSFIDDEDVIVSSQKDPSPKSTSDFSSQTSSNFDQSGVAYIEIKVKSGDALEKIARNNGTTVEAIKQLNNLSSTKLSIGQTLKIPTKENVAAVQSKTPAKPAATTLTPAPKAVASNLTPAPKQPTQSTESQYYTVKSGDSPWKISKEMGISVEELLRLNGMDEAKARNMKVGDKIRIK